MLASHLNKNNLHHAYLIEGEPGEVLPQIIKFLKNMSVDTHGNPDFIQINTDTFKIDDARLLKSYGSQRGFSYANEAKKIFVISANSFLLEAQNSLLKLFEEPIPNTHFFLITPDVNSLLETLVSRFYLISTRQDLKEAQGEAEKFLKMTERARLDFIKKLLTVDELEDGEGNEIASVDSARSKATKFLNALESILHNQMSKMPFDTLVEARIFEHFFKVRKYLRMPGSSAKTLMESLAFITPNFSK